MSIDQETRERILREMEEWFERLGDVSEAEVLAMLAEDNPNIVTEPFYRWKHLAEQCEEEPSHVPGSASMPTVS